MDGIYLTWLISALAFGVILLPVFKPPWSKVSAPPFLDFMRRYWVHILLLVMVYNAKDFLDQIDRILMARTGLDMTLDLCGRGGSSFMGSGNISSNLA